MIIQVLKKDDYETIVQLSLSDNPSAEIIPQMYEFDLTDVIIESDKDSFIEKVKFYLKIFVKVHTDSITLILIEASILHHETDQKL